ncbi:MAG: hypothetical protein IIA17_08480 [candidate division Zixibacteria bacterium]|nr:hypothetical protein [candidate division Zixibacteria bacterium]
MPEPKLDCLGMGIIPLDLLFGVKKYPEAGQKIDGTWLTIQGGGPVPNVMIGLSRLGCQSSLIAVIGDDIFGELTLSELKSEKVDSSQIIIKRKTSAVAAGFVEEGSGRRTLVLERQLFVEPKDIKLKNLRVPRIIHLDGRDMEATIKLAKWAKKVGALVSFDIGSMRNDVSAVFKYVDHLVVADTYALGFTKTTNAKAAIKKLTKYCPGTIVVTAGIKGSTGYESGRFYKQPAYKVKNVDTTGAGDAFHTGYIFGLLKKEDLKERLHLGAAVAAIKCTIAGSRAGLPGPKQLSNFLKNRPRKYA